MIAPPIASTYWLEVRLRPQLLAAEVTTESF